MLLELLLLCGALALFVYHNSKVPDGMPPGNLGWPIIGDIPAGNKHVYQHFRALAQKYGKICTTKLGSHLVVIFSDVQLTKKAYNHPGLQGRKELNSFLVMNNYDLNTGVIFSSGGKWAANRRFLLRHLRDLGMGKTSLENSIQEEAGLLVKHLEKQNLEEPVALDWSINVSVLNVIWQLLAGMRYEVDDAEVLKLTKMLDDDIEIAMGPMFLLDMMPWLSMIMPLSLRNKLFRVDKFENNRKLFRKMMNKIIDEHRVELDSDQPRDIIDHYLVEIERHKNDPSVIHKFIHADLEVVMNDLFTGGTETTSTTLRWMLLYLASFPKVQKKAHQELDRVVAKDKLPSLRDRSQLSYIDALILDTLRLSSLVPIGVQHSATEDVHIEGYKIPKGTMLFANIETFHHDPALWEKPDVLFPEHFLDSEGKLDSKKDAFMPFAVGRRQCLGESLARMELFLFGSAILHRFEVSAPPGVKLNLETDPVNYLLRQPSPFKVILKKRT